MGRPTTFAELQDSAERELALLEQQALGREMAIEPERRLREAAIKSRQRDRERALALAVPGVIVQMTAYRNVPAAVFGAVLSVIGCIYWMKSKGREPALGLMAAIPLLGLCVLGFLKDRLAKELNLPD